jgi:hypothetical protein
MKKIMKTITRKWCGFDGSKTHTKDGHEIPDPKPTAVAVAFRKAPPPTLSEQVARIVKNQAALAKLQAAGFESPEEADDFDVGEDYDPTSPYEHDFDLTATGANIETKDTKFVEEVPNEVESNPEPSKPVSEGENDE